MSRPLIVKIHRDILFSPKSSEGEIKCMADGLESGLQSIFKQYTPVVIGYGGNDSSLMGFLEGIDSIAGGMFWCLRDVDGVPAERIANLVRKHNGRFVLVKSFDDLMIQLGDRLKVPRQDRAVIEIAAKRAETYRSQIDAIGKTENNDVETEKALSNIIERSEEKDWLYYIQLARRAKTVDSKDAAYRAGIEQFPISPQMLGSYANFLKNYKKDIAGAEEYYKRALEANPNSAVTLGNYAVFLIDDKKDIAGAEAYYKRALEADPNHANNLGNYVKLLIEKDMLEQSLAYLKQAFSGIDQISASPALEIELWFYAYALFHEEYPESSEKIDGLLNEGIRSPGWNLDGVIETARKHGHPDFGKLQEYARLISGG